MRTLFTSRTVCRRLPLCLARALLSLFAGVFHSRRDDDVHGHALIHWGDVVVPGAIVENSHHGLLFALRYRKNAAFSPSIRADGPQFEQDPVTMHGIPYVRWRNKDVALQLVPGARGQGIRLRSDKAVAVTVHVQASGDQVQAGGSCRQGPAVFAYRRQLALAGQLFEQAFQCPPLPALDGQVMDHLLESGGMPGLPANVAEDFLVVHHCVNDSLTLTLPKHERFISLRALPDIRNACQPGIITHAPAGGEVFLRTPVMRASPANPAVLEFDPGKRGLATHLRRTRPSSKVSRCTSGRRLD